ncbi:MAG: hypothetical protein IKU82_03690, partial [Clostridia bacterium]|nr:hypothetical protein [Clostridia bacterium]
SIDCKLICAALVVLAPVILLAYVVILCKKFQPRFFASAVYVICSVLAVFSLLPYAFSAIYSMIVYGSPLPQISYIISIILQFLIAISFLILAIIGLFKLKNKIIPAVAILTIILLQLILTPMLMTGAGMGFVIAIILITISIMALYIALLVLVLSSETIPISNSESEQ